jgi:hypothetical protein
VVTRDATLLRRVLRAPCLIALAMASTPAQSRTPAGAQPG